MANPNSITSANAVVLLGVNGLFPTAVQLQGFASEEIFATEAINTLEMLMGLDNKLSGGYVPQAVPAVFSLQANSPSMSFFDTWSAQERTVGEKFMGFGIITLPAIGLIVTGKNGYLGQHMLFPDAKKVLQPRTFQVLFESITVANF